MSSYTASYVAKSSPLFAYDFQATKFGGVQKMKKIHFGDYLGVYFHAKLSS